MVCLKTDLDKETVLQNTYLLQNYPNTRQCTRGKVSVRLLDSDGGVVSIGRNFLHLDDAPCVCNDGVDTMVAGSQTCKAVHAEIMAIQYAQRHGLEDAVHTIVTTRPPCKRCIPEILAVLRFADLLITSDQYLDRDASEGIWTSPSRAWLTIDHTALPYFR